MRTIKQILDRKSRRIASIKPDRTVFEALQYMAEKNIGSIIVMEKDKYLGVLTERDYARKVILMNRSSKTILVNEIMSVDLPFLIESDNIERCMSIMSELNIRYLPVLEGENLVGIISVKDVVDEMLIQQKEIIDDLTNYITRS